MTAEKYVNTIIKQIKCSNAKRKEIRRQLLSDISAAQEQGESLDAIINRMGSAKNMAREFNENLSETESKKYVKGRRIKIVAFLAAILAAILTILVILAYWFLPKGAEIASSGIFEETVVEEKIKDVVERFNQDDYETLRAEAIEEIQSALTKEQMAEAKNQISEDWGSYQSMGNIYMSEVSQMGKHYVVGEITVVYEHVSITFRLTFDEDMKLAGLYMR